MPGSYDMADRFIADFVFENQNLAQALRLTYRIAN